MMNMHPSWAIGIIFVMAFIVALVLGCFLLCAFLITRRRKQQVASLEPAWQASARTVLPAEETNPEDVQIHGCPVCGADLPADTPQGLCPQCLMKCVLSHSDHGEPHEEEGETTGYPGQPAAPTPAELAAHFPDLEILELLGQGGMGAVYKARQRKLDRLVAIKVLPPEWGRDPAFAERFAREARALARLNHPQIVSVHDFGEAGGHFFLVMEYVDGANVRQLLMSGRLRPRQALPIVAQICDALQYAHEQGIVHRDIKPENILLDRRGRVKIADFGLAKLVGRSSGEFTLTGSRQIMGTLHYMAPEQQTTPQSVDHRADIYSLGVVFYEMLTGELPLGRFLPPSQKAPVDGRLDEVVFRALETEPNRRYQRISAIKADVESILRAGSWAPSPSGAPERWEPDLAMVQLQTRGPAAGMIVMALLMVIQAIVIPLAVRAMGSHGGAIDLICVVVMLAGFLLSALVVIGAVKLAHCRGFEWVMIAIILIMLPIGYHWFASLPIGIWALVVLARPEVKEAFAHHLRRAQRELAASPPAVSEPAPTQPGGGKMRGFLLSVFSVFASRAALAQPPAAREEASAVMTTGQPGVQPAQRDIRRI